MEPEESESGYSEDDLMSSGNIARTFGTTKGADIPGLVKVIFDFAILIFGFSG
jgi:hypothetical protein